MTTIERVGGYEKCGANGRSGKPCARPAGWGTDHPGVGRCKLHLGSTAKHRKAASTELAKRECATLGIPVETTAAEALLHEVREAKGNTIFYTALIQQLPIHPEDDRYVIDEEAGRGRWERGEPGLYGRTYHQSGVPTGEAREHILVRLYNDERKRLKEASEGALKAGIEERLVRIAEADAQRIESAYIETLKGMGLGDRLEEFRNAFRDNLSAEHLAAIVKPAHLGAAV